MHACFLNIPFILYIIIIDIDIPSLYVGLQIKGKFACSVCGPKIKSHCSKRLRKEVFDEYRNFLSKNQRYRKNEKRYFQWEAGYYIKITENDTLPLEVAL